MLPAELFGGVSKLYSVKNLFFARTTQEILMVLSSHVSLITEALHIKILGLLFKDKSARKSKDFYSFLTSCRGHKSANAFNRDKLGERRRCPCHCDPGQAERRVEI